MATPIADIITQCRRARLQEVVPRFWTQDELVGHFNAGMRDLWKALKDVYQDHFRTIDDTNVSLAASATTLTGVPTDVATVLGIEPRDPVSRPIIFVQKDYLHPDFQAARFAGAQSAQDPSQRSVIYYDIDGAGGPVAAPTIRIAPPLSSALNLTLIYVPVLAARTIADTNPIPGESDLALELWIAAHALPKQRESQEPDPGMLAAYEVEKAKIATAATPRDESEPDVVEAFFEMHWEG